MLGEEFPFSFSDLRLRLHEAYSLARCTSLNKANVDIFFKYIRNVYERYPCLGNGLRGYNLDEIGLSTVQTLRKVFADGSVK